MIETFRNNYQDSSSFASRIAVRFRSQAIARAKLKTSLQQFSEHYEDLIDLLCSAAREGIFPHKETEYEHLRLWFQKHYVSIRSMLRSEMKEWEGIMDPFEELFIPQTLEEVITHPTSVQNITLTRQALEACLLSVA